MNFWPGGLSWRPFFTLFFPTEASRNKKKSKSDTERENIKNEKVKGENKAAGRIERVIGTGASRQKLWPVG